jgi:hypothetical protein
MILRIRARAKIEAGQPQEPTHELGIPTYEMRPSAILETYYCEVVAVKELEYPHGGFIRTYDLKQSVGKSELQDLYLVVQADADEAIFSKAELCRRFKSGGTDRSIVEEIQVVRDFPGISLQSTEPQSAPVAAQVYDYLAGGSNPSSRF